jgi:outer membrane protein assembly factor BamB
MRFIITLIIFFLTIHYNVVAADVSQCTLLKGIDKNLSQGLSAPIVQSNGRVIILDIRGILHYYNNKLLKIGELDLSVYHKKISRVSSHHVKNEDYHVIIDNVLYAITDTENTGEILWKKKFSAPIKGISEIFNNKLGVLTADNYVYMLDATSGDSLWLHYNGTHDVRLGLYSVIGSHSASPVFAYSKRFDRGIIVVPFLNGELKAFDESGKMLWSYKLHTDSINTPFINITNVVISSISDNIIATNKSVIAAIDMLSGNLLWSQPIHVQTINTDSEFTGLLAVTEDDRVLKISKNDGKIMLDTKLPIHNGKYVISVNPDLHDSQVFIVSNTGVMFVLDTYSGDLTRTINIPKDIYHKVTFSRDLYFTTYRKGAYVCYE